MERTYQIKSQPASEQSSVILLEKSQEKGADSAESSLVNPHIYPSSDLVSNIYTLQRILGNRAVQRFLLPTAVSEGKSLAASQASPQNAAVVVQPKCACGDRCSKCQQRKQGMPRLMALSHKLPGKTLEPTVRAQLEDQLGEDFSEVKVHTDEPAKRMAAQLQADACTVRRDIFFGAGKYDPHSYQGRRLLAHELTHVVQQTRGLRPARSTISVGQPGDRYEREADQVAERVTRPEPPASTYGWLGREGPGARVKIRERWRGTDTLLSRAAVAAASEKKPAPMKSAGLTSSQVACIKRVYEQAMKKPKSDRWKQCYITAKTRTCNLPELKHREDIKVTLNEAIAPVDWDRYLADPKGLIHRVQGGESPETFCEEAPPPKEKPQQTKQSKG